MNQILRFALRSLHLLGLRPAARYIRTTFSIFRYGYLLIMAAGLIGAGYYQEGWPLWLSIPCGGVLWFVLEARILFIALVLRFVPSHKIGDTELKVPDELHPAKIGLRLSTIGMWSLVTSLGAALLQIYRPIRVPGFGIQSWFVPYLAFAIVVLFLVATSESSLKYWRGKLGWGMAIVIVGMVVLLVAFRFFPGYSLYFVDKTYREDAHKELQSNFESSIDKIRTASLEQVKGEFVALEKERLAWQYAHGVDSVWPSQTRYDQLIAIQDSPQKQPKTKTEEEEDSSSMKDYLNPRMVMPAGILLCVFAVVLYPLIKE